MKLTVLLCVAFAAICSGIEFQGLEKLPPDTRWVKLSPGPVGDIWSDCSQSDDPAKIGTVTITPDPPKKGMNVTVDANGTLMENVTGGTIDVKVKWDIITVFDKTLDLCVVAKQAGIDCPIKAGNVTLNASEEIPNIAPGGHYTGNVEVKDQNGKELVCINLDFHL